MFAEGLGTSKDPKATNAWIASASLAGDQRGRDLLPALETALGHEKTAEAQQEAQNLRIEFPQRLSPQALVP